MIDKLNNELLFQQQALSLLNKRQDILGSNIANADTPGYLARDIDFSKSLSKAVEQRNATPLSLDMTSANHISAQAKNIFGDDILYRTPDQPSADGNTVDMDRERVNFADNNVKYQSSLSFISAQIKNMMSVIN